MANELQPTAESPKQKIPQFVSSRELDKILDEAKTAGRDPVKVFKALVKTDHEIEGYNAKYSPLETVSNALPSLVELGKNVVEAFKNPMQTLSGLDEFATGFLDRAVGLDPSKRKASTEDKFNAVLDFYAERYGGVDRILNTVETDPAGVLADLSTIGQGGAGVLKGAVGGAAKTGLLSTRAATRAAQTVETLNRVSSTIDPLTATSKLVVGAARKANNAVGLNRLIRDVDVNEKMIEALQLKEGQIGKIADKTYTKNIGERLAKWGVTGSLKEMSDQLGEIATKSKQLLDNRLASVKDLYKNESVRKVLDNLQELKNNIPFDKLAKDLQDQYNRVIQLAVKHENKGLTLSEINETKRMLGEIVDDKVFKADNDFKLSQAKKNLGKLYSETKKVVESEASKKGMNYIPELNSQNQFAHAVKSTIDRKILTGAAKFDKAKDIANIGTIILSSTPSAITGTLKRFGLSSEIAAKRGAFEGPFYQVIRSPRFQSDFATAIQLLKDGDFQKLAGGVTFAKKTGTVQKRLKNLQSVGNTIRILNKVISNLSQAYPTLKGIRFVRQSEYNKEQEDE